MLEVHVFDARRTVAQRSELESARGAAPFALGPLAVDEEPDPLLEAEVGVAAVTVELLLESTGEAMHAQLGELLEGPPRLAAANLTERGSG